MHVISRSEFAKQINGAELDREITRLSSQGGGWIEIASLLSRRVNNTLDWEPLGGENARYSKILASRGEAVVFWDDHLKNRVLKLRGREENGFGGAGFGCILGRNDRGLVGYLPGTIEQALEREAISWGQLGFACTFEAVIEGDVGLLLAQNFVKGDPPMEKEIHTYMTEHGWESQKESDDVSPKLRGHAWRRGDVGAFDANETNFVKADADGKLYPIDLIMWHWPD